MVGMKEAGGKDDSIVLKTVTLLLVGWMTDKTPEELIVCVNEVMLRANDVVVLPWEVDTLFLEKLLGSFNVCAKSSVSDAADIL